MSITKKPENAKRKGNLVMKGLKIFFITLGASLFLVIVLFIFFFIPWIKKQAIAYVEEHSEYTLKMNSIAFIGLHDVEITGIEFRPKLALDQFYKENSTERDWIKGKGHLSLEGVDWRAFIRDKKMYADKISFNEMEIYIFRDKRKPDGPYKKKFLHSALLRNAFYTMTFPVVELVNSKIEYEEHPEEGSEAIINFTNLQGTLLNLSNDSFYTLKHPEVVLTAKGMILDSIEGRMIYKFSTVNKKDHFSFEGHTGPFPASLFNKCTIPMAGCNVKSGYVKRIDLFFHANNQSSNGTIDIDYDGLEVDFHKKNTAFMKFFIREDDRKRNGKERKAGEIDCTRDTGSSVFNYWWASIKSGLLSSITIKLPFQKKKK